MGSATRESLEAVTGEVTGRADLASVAVADELFSLSRSIMRVTQLKHELTDGAIETAERQALIAKLYGSAVSAQAIQALDLVVARQWSEPEDLIIGIERAGIVAIAAAAAKDGTLATLESELFQVEQVLAQHSDLRLALTEHQTTADEAKALIGKIFGGKVSDGAISILGYAAMARHEGKILPVLRAAAEVVSGTAGRQVARVTVARELPDAKWEHLKAQLEDVFATKLHVNEVVDPEVVGGVRVQVGSEVIDSTIQTKLVGLREALAG